ncbi:hypothetical protein FFWV33_09315 [Flavobacterium faecale]|uniref:Uncharacterized protein n=1 Tax=Flavobacterium faecale TaxID=1355330 RepID=A0A2S1LD87_9FLAO|nr:hypothetical protein [Flavobacterium faecale]AWG21723.1 hypothetical protein FFWV33_09315 [Flavobacterium faecale]
MKKYLLIIAFLCIGQLVAQDISGNDPDKTLKEKIYTANKKRVMNFSKKQFDALFFEFFEKKNNVNTILSKEEFYQYTIQIAIFSDRLATLYPEEIQIANESKAKWLAEQYDDYLSVIKAKTK